MSAAVASSMSSTGRMIGASSGDDPAVTVVQHVVARSHRASSFPWGLLARSQAYVAPESLSNPRRLLPANTRANIPPCTHQRRSQQRPEHRPNLAQPVPNAVVRRNKTVLCLPQVVRAPHTNRGIMEQFETILRGIEAAAPFDKGRAGGIFSTPTHCAQSGR